MIPNPKREALLKQCIEDLPFSYDLLNAFVPYGIETLGEILDYKVAELHNMPDLTCRAFYEFYDYLVSVGLEWELRHL